MKPLALAAALAVALMLCGVARADWSAVRTAESGPSCSLAELDVLEIEIGFDGWVEWNLSSQSVADRELAKACRKVPARWRALNRSFLESTRFVDRLYPGYGFGAWANECAKSEGGHGLFVMNRQGSGAGGWLQFMSSTFWGVIYPAVARARAQGVRIPDYAMTWTSPLGQAIAGAEMRFRDRRSEWTGATC